MTAPMSAKEQRAGDTERAIDLEADRLTQRHRSMVTAAVIVAVFVVLAAMSVALAVVARSSEQRGKQVDRMLVRQAESNRLITELRAQVAALQEQVRQLGGKPVVVVERPSPRNDPSTPPPRPNATTTTTTRQPAPTTTTTQPCRPLPLIGCAD